jgi:hypothetical protein
MAHTAFAEGIGREFDPLILKGADLPMLMGAEPTRVVAFRYDSDWIQIPLQIDEMAVVDFGTIYNIDPTGYTVLTYADTSTFTGPDPDPTFDEDDELVLMAKHAGLTSQASAEPGGAIPGTGVELIITDPLGGAEAYAYLFETDGSLDPGAGSSPITYDFVLLSGDYKETYDTMSGPNPEDSEVITDFYRVHFSDRWIRDETGVTSGEATGADILDRHKALFAPGNCTRSEDTFSAGEGAFIINRTGPVRALRGYVGANSGPTTYRIHRFYEEREDIQTVLRVHAIPGIMDYFDYSAEASGMVFRDDLNPNGVLVDGVPDNVTLGSFTWEMVSGLQGTLVMTMVMETDIPGFDYSSYYSDNIDPPEHQCTGDDFEYGASGLWEEDFIPNTDPALGDHFVFQGFRIMVFGEPDQGFSYAEERADEAQNPVTAVARPYTPGASDVPSVTASSNLRISVAPNPFGNRLRIGFALANPGPVRVGLYDLLGRRVASVGGDHWEGGDHRVDFDTSQLAAGEYFARVSLHGKWCGVVRVVRIR